MMWLLNVALKIPHTSVTLFPVFTVETQLKPGDLGTLKVKLGDVAAYWVAIADQLGMSSKVANIKSAVLNVGPSHFLRDLLERWLGQNPPPTLEALCKALRADSEIIGGAQVARELEDEFGKRRGL